MNRRRYREPGLGSFVAAFVGIAFLNLLWLAAVVGVILLVLSIAGVL